MGRRRLDAATRDGVEQRASRGFTLIEIMAVVLIMGLLTVMVIPSLGSTRASALRAAALDVAGRIELARQRAIMTGKPHRLWIDLEDGSHRVEWWVNQSEADGEPQAFGTNNYDLANGAPLSLSPPIDETVDYRPLPNQVGRTRWLNDALFFDGIETPQGWLEDGEVAVVFDRNGTTEPAELVISDDFDGKIYLEILPLLDHVRIFHGES